VTKCAQVEVTVPDCVQYMLWSNVRELSNTTPKIFSSSVVVLVLSAMMTDSPASTHAVVVIPTTTRRRYPHTELATATVEIYYKWSDGAF